MNVFQLSDKFITNRNIILVFIVICCSWTTAKGQNNTCDCKSDMQFLDSKIKKLKSYKRNKSDYDLGYEKAFNTIQNKETLYDCFIVLNQLLTPLRDHHMSIIYDASDSLNISRIIYPVYKANLEELKAGLQVKPQEDVEGIYHQGNNISIGIAYDTAQNMFDAIVLQSQQKNWNTGDIIYKIKPLEHGVYKVMGGQYPSRRLIAYHEKIDKGMLLRAGFKKDTSATYFNKNPYPDQKLVFKALNPQTDYLRVGSFRARYPYLKEAENFYAELKDQLKKPNLILDLRDNGGGGNRNSDILFKLLKQYLKKDNKIYILINASTGSNAEQFTLKLMKYDGAVSFGDRTRGALTYEIKPGDYYTLPSSGFMAILPSKTHNEYLSYETKGIKPDHVLDYNTSWLEQIEEFIN